MKPLFVLAFCAVALAGVALALFTLLRGPRERPVDARRLGLCVWRVFELQLLAILGLWPLGLHVFGVMNLAWIVGTVVAPAAGLGVLLAFARGRPVTRPTRVVAVLSLLAVPLAVDAQFVCPDDLRTEQATVALDASRSGVEPLRIAVLADLQCTSIGDHEREAFDRIVAMQPDLVLVPGDIYQGPTERFEQELPAFQEQFRRLHAPGGVWVVPGNTDYQDGLLRLLEGSDARLLRDRIGRVRVRDREVAIFGADERPHELEEVWRSGTPGLLDFAEAPEDGSVRILLAHRPRIVDELPPQSRVDLVVSGHTHGGQVALPFLGPPLVLSPLPRQIAAGGLHERAGNRVYISRGVGMERMNAPRIRFLVPPEVSLLTLADVPLGDAP
ncbi:MAG: metallophosphoesterase [Planctomycetes bacterium]|nr:metallophosphoesterase [Planctomycetota bacterium]